MKKLLMMSALTMAVAMPAAMANDANWDKKIDAKFSKMDTDGNGSVSKAEHDAASQDMFTKADANGDGMLTKDELKTAMQNEKAGMKTK